MDDPKKIREYIKDIYNVLDEKPEAKKILSKKDFDTFASETAKQVAKVAEENGYKPVIDKTKPNVTIKKLKEVADALDIDFLQFDDLEVDYLEEEEDLYVTGLDIDFLQQNFLADILKQINEELALQMQNEFDKKRSIDGIFLGKNPETGVIILDEDPQWFYAREGAGGQYIELRLDKQYGYIINIVQGEFIQYDFELGGQDNIISITQTN